MGQINLLKTDTPQTPSSGRTGIFIDSTNAPILILDDGSEIPLGGTTLEQIYIDAITGGLNPSSENPFITLEQLNNAVSGGVNSVLEGGNVQWSGSGLVFYTSFSRYIIQGTLYEDTSGTLTLTTADATNGRRDRFKLTTSGWDFDTGTPAATPIAPQVNLITEIDRGDVLVPALATTPTVTDENVYLENTEWTTGSGGSGTFDANSTADPFAGTKSFEATSIQAGGYMQFTNGTDFDFADLETLGFQLKLKATMNNGRFIRVQFLDNSDVIVGSSNALAIDKSNTSTYQFIGIGINQIVTSTNSFRKIRLIYQGSGGPSTYTGYFVDNVIIESGISQGFDPTFTQDEINAVKEANAPSSSNPFATIADIVAGGVETVTGDGVDNTDPLNPVIGYQAAAFRESNTVLFDGDYITGVNASPRTGNILFDFTGAKLGAVTIMYHQDASAFTFPTEAELNFDSGTDISTTKVNKFMMVLVDDTPSAEKVDVMVNWEGGTP